MLDEIISLEPVIVRAHPKFQILYNLPIDTNVVICIGGRGGAKTYEVSKWVAFESTIKQRRCVVLRDEKELIRESILNEVLTRYDTANKDGMLDYDYERLDVGIRQRKTREMVVFTKGFRASDSQKSANMKSISNVDIAVVEEAEDIRDVDKFNTFADSIRNQGSIIVIILNTPDINHWVIKRYFNLELVEDGYWKIVPKDLKGFVCIQTSFEDNPYLPDHIVANYNGYGDPSHHLFNKHYYLTAIKGYASSGRKGQILTKVGRIKLADYLNLPYKEVYAQDFGPASPAATLGGKWHGNKLYFRGLNYKGLNTLQIALKYIEWGFTAQDEIVADPADRNACNLLSDGFTNDDAPLNMLQQYPQLRQGFNVFRAPKGHDSISNDIDMLDSIELIAVEDGEEAENIWNEIRNWVYAQDKWGNYTNEAIDNWNHYMDCLRYLVQHRNRGDYGISRTN
jgi:phage terminase large subunit